MKKNSDQTGSAHAVIVILLSIGLMGALGYIFWQNSSQRNTEQAADRTALTDRPLPTKKVQYKTVNLAEQYSDVGSVQMPLDWSIERSVNREVNDVLSITSPKAELKITYVIYKGFFDAVGFEDSRKVTSFSYERLENAKDVAYVEVQSTHGDNDRLDSGYIGLKSTSGEYNNPESVKVGDTMLKAAGYPLILIRHEKPVTNENHNNVIMISTAVIRLADRAYDSKMTDVEVQEIKKSPDYEMAKQILLGTELKNK